MAKHAEGLRRLQSGIRNLDSLLLGGGFPQGSVVLVSGPPGSGKTIFTQQVCFHNASPRSPVLYFNTLSEPTVKVLRYLRPFSFFDASKLESSFHFVDLGVILRSQGLENGINLIMDQVKNVKPGVVVIDSFKVFEDLARSQEELRKFGYELTVKLLAWECSVFLLGEYAPHDFETNPVFSIIDGLITMSQRPSAGEQQRFLQIVKMRGTGHSRAEHPFAITDEGIAIFTPRETIRREPRADALEPRRVRVGIPGLDALLGEGIPSGSSVLVGGASGTGKTVLLLEFVYRGALQGEKGIVFSFEETEERLRAAARGLGWTLDAEIERGMVQIVFIPETDVVVEQHLLMVQERVASTGARRVAIDSSSVFLYKIEDRQSVREKVFQLASIVQNNQAVGFFATDIPYGSGAISRYGVEETVADGVILVSAQEEGLERERYLEVYKLRNTAHLNGRHSMTIGRGGITVFPRYRADEDIALPPPPVESKKRLSTGVPGLDALLGGGLLARSVTLASGSTGVGKSTLGMHFVLAAAAAGERALYVTIEEGSEQILNDADALGLPLRKAVADGLVEIAYHSRHGLRPHQLFATIVERLQALGARRLLLDGAMHVAGSQSTGEARKLLHRIVAQLKRLDVTALFTVESTRLFDTDVATDDAISAVSDNLIVMRYARAGPEVKRIIAVLKTRGSAHDPSTTVFSIGRGGVTIASPGSSRPRQKRS